MIVNAAASSARILIVEDDFGMRLVVKRLLEHYREQYVPVFAASVAKSNV